MSLVKFVKIHEKAQLPVYKTELSSGADLCSVEDMVLWSHANGAGPVKIHTGLKLAWLEPQYELQIRPRSGLGLKGLIIPNSPGTIDADYRGEIIVLMVNLNPYDEYVVKAGDRIAQMVLAPVIKASFEFVEAELGTDTVRGTGGFGSTGN